LDLLSAQRSVKYDAIGIVEGFGVKLSGRQTIPVDHLRRKAYLPWFDKYMDK